MRWQRSLWALVVAASLFVAGCTGTGIRLKVGQVVRQQATINQDYIISMDAPAPMGRMEQSLQATLTYDTEYTVEKVEGNSATFNYKLQNLKFGGTAGGTSIEEQTLPDVTVTVQVNVLTGEVLAIEGDLQEEIKEVEQWIKATFSGLKALHQAKPGDTWTVPLTVAVPTFDGSKQEINMTESYTYLNDGTEDGTPVRNLKSQSDVPLNLEFDISGVQAVMTGIVKSTGNVAMNKRDGLTQTLRGTAQIDARATIQAPQAGGESLTMKMTGTVRVEMKRVP